MLNFVIRIKKIMIDYLTGIVNKKRLRKDLTLKLSLYF